jgi:hypothetical protein
VGGEEGPAGGAGAAGEGSGAEVKWQVGRDCGRGWFPLEFSVGEKREAKTKEESEVPR